MKSSLKVLLLILASLGAVAAVLFFAKTRVAPPSEVEMSDYYPETLSEECNAIYGVYNIEDKRTAYNMLKDKIERFNIEGRITDTEADTRHEEISDDYSSALTKYSYDLFNKPHWDRKELDDMLKMVDELSNDYLSDGSKATRSSFTRNAENLHKIVQSYDQAIKHANDTKFVSVEDADNKVEMANKFKNDYYLQNNLELVQALYALPEKIAQNHLQYLKNLSAKLRNYKSYPDYDTYKYSIVNEVDDAFFMYDIASYCYNKPSYADLYTQNLTTVQAASDYFASKEDPYNYYW